MINYITFGSSRKEYSIAIMVKDSAFREPEIKKFYVDPLVLMGIPIEAIIAIPLPYNQQEKIPVSFIKEKWEELKKLLKWLNISHVLMTDAAYFKTVCKLRKAEPHLGYVQSVSISPDKNLAVCLGWNYSSIYYNPSLANKLNMGLQTVAQSYLGKTPLFQNDLYQNTQLLENPVHAYNALEDLHNYPAITVDIETTDLCFRDAQVVSIAFAVDENHGFAFSTVSSNFQTSENFNKLILKNFFLTYSGKLIFHNANFDTKFLIKYLWMNHLRDLESALAGLECLYRNLEDTKLLTYLATNTTAGNRLGLKEQAFEFTGNYALEDFSNITLMSMEEVLRYNVTDTLATWYVYNKYRQVIKETQEQVYQEVFLPALKVITFQEIVGIPYSYKKALNLNNTLRDKANIIMDQLAQSDPVKEVEEILQLNALLDSNNKLKFKKKELADFKDLTFNPQSNKQLRILLYEVLNLPVLSSTATGLASTDGDTLNQLILHIKNQIKDNDSP